MIISHFFNKKYLLVLVFLIVITVSSLVIWWILKFNNGPSNHPEQNGNQEETKTYRNTEFGFEFQYPEDWSFHENTFGSPFSKFNLVGAAPEENNHPDPLTPSILVNIVTPDFADRTSISFKNLNANTSIVVIAGIEGVKYEYEFENMMRIGIDLPFGDYRMLLGAKKEYEDTFNQIISTLKFLK